MRDRLIWLIRNAKAAYRSMNDAVMSEEEFIADFILADGVIVPPCKVGDTVYSINKKAISGHWEDNRYIVDEWSEYKVFEKPFSLTLWECGWEGIFLTREEAEQKLKEGKG